MKGKQQFGANSALNDPAWGCPGVGRRITLLPWRPSWFLRLQGRGVQLRMS